MADAISVAARVMADDLYRLNVTSQNLANAGTAGYKREIVASRPFVELLRAGLPAQGAARLLPVSLPALGSAVDVRPGPLVRTGGALDVALDGEGFFELAADTGPVFTRQGSFRIDAQGRLVSAAGLAVMGGSGELSLTGAQPEIDAQGRVYEGGRLAGQLRIVQFASPRELTPLGGGLYRAQQAAQIAAPAGGVRQGFLESSNVAALAEMVRMIELTRRFEAAQRIVQGYDGMLGGAIRTLGEF
jgi:flagellar basal-body rod protein FlgG